MPIFCFWFILLQSAVIKVAKASPSGDVIYRSSSENANTTNRANRSGATRNMVGKSWFSFVSYWICSRLGKRLAISIPMLQKWRRWVFSIRWIHNIKYISIKNVSIYIYIAEPSSWEMFYSQFFVWRSFVDVFLKLNFRPFWLSAQNEVLRIRYHWTNEYAWATIGEI